MRPFFVSRTRLHTSMYAPVALALERTQPATLLLRLEAPFIYDREKSEPTSGSLFLCGFLTLLANRCSSRLFLFLRYEKARPMDAFWESTTPF